MNSIVEAGGQTQWWTTFPWIEVAIFFAGMTAWQIWDAFFQKDSWIRIWLKERRRLYRLEGVQNLTNSNNKDYFYMKVFKKDSFETSQAYIITNNSEGIEVLPAKMD